MLNGPKDWDGGDARPTDDQLESIRISLSEIARGELIPISELWDGIDTE